LVATVPSLRGDKKKKKKKGKFQERMQAQDYGPDVATII
jgi:hypothetical protein